jgi:3-phosphoshikimate 1-carboxyvinyltransferase
MDVVVAKAKPLVGELRVPGDKSISHRALLIAGIADGTSVIRGLLNAADPLSTMQCLDALGVQVNTKGELLEVHGNGLHGFKPPSADLDAGNSGTTLRLLCGILAGHSFHAVLTGDQSLRRRPMARVIQPLRRMGAEISSENDTPPVHIRGKTPLDPIEYTMPIASAQVKSAILLAGLYAQGITTVRESTPTRDHTERMLGLSRRFEGTGTTISILGGTSIRANDFHIPGDLSSAAFLLTAAACIRGSECTIRSVGINPTRTAILSVLERSGVRITMANRADDEIEPYADLHTVYSPPERPIHLQRDEVPLLIDEIPVLAVLAACAGTAFSVQGAGELRVKESDRIALLVRNLKRMGVQVVEERDGFAFEPVGSLRSAEIESGGDHRLAMAFAVAGMIHGGVTVKGAECADVSFPGFWNLIKRF